MKVLASGQARQRLDDFVAVTRGLA